MKIEKLDFEKTDVEITETYIDENGFLRERKRMAQFPTGKLTKNAKVIEGGEKDGK